MHHMRYMPVWGALWCGFAVARGVQVVSTACSMCFRNVHALPSELEVRSKPDMPLRCSRAKHCGCRLVACIGVRSVFTLRWPAPHCSSSPLQLLALLNLHCHACTHAQGCPVWAVQGFECLLMTPPAQRQPLEVMAAQ